MNKINQARATRIGLSLGATAVLGIALGCGEIGGAGQCFGVDETGVCVTIDSIVPTDTINTADTSDVDAFQTADCDGDLTTVDPEPFGKHSATVAISVTLMPGVVSSQNGGPAPSFVTITGYTIEYVAVTAGAPNLNAESYTAAQKIDAGASATMTLEFVSISNKALFGSNASSSGAPAQYQANYTITGTTEFVDPLILKGSTSFNMANYSHCS